MKNVLPLACNFIKKETLAQVFSVNFVKFLRTPFLNCFATLLKSHFGMGVLL